MARTNFPHSLKVGLTDLDMVLLAFLQRLTNAPMADHLRNALEGYAGYHFHGSEREFRAFAHDFALTAVGADRRDRFLQRIERFCERFGLQRETAVTETTGVPSVEGFRSDVSHFDHD